MNYKDICFYDFETTSPNPYKCQPIQLASVIIDTRKLEIREGSLFCSYIKPEFDSEKCAKHGFDELSDEVTKITGITKDNLVDAPSLELVWSQFKTYIQKYNPSKSKWKSLIKAGHNINGFDNIIVDRICGGHLRPAKNQLDYMTKNGILDVEKVRIVEPWGFGPWDNDRMEETLFAPRDSIDLMGLLFMWTENLEEVKSLSMDATRDWLGISKEGAHKADKDVMDGAKVLIKFLKFHRSISAQTKFKGSCKDF